METVTLRRIPWRVLPHVLGFCALILRVALPVNTDSWWKAALSIAGLALVSWLASSAISQTFERWSVGPNMLIRTGLFRSDYIPLADIVEVRAGWLWDHDDGQTVLEMVGRDLVHLDHDEFKRTSMLAFEQALAERGVRVFRRPINPDHCTRCRNFQTPPPVSPSSGI